MNALKECLHPKSEIEAIKTPIGNSDFGDKLYWPLTLDGNYSVRSGYKCLMESATFLDVAPSSSYSNSEVSWKMIWSVKVPYRIGHFVWRVKHNAISTRKNLMRRKITRDALCSICNSEEETMDHLFFSMSLDNSSVVWSSIVSCA